MPLGLTLSHARCLPLARSGVGPKCPLTCQFRGHLGLTQSRAGGLLMCGSRRGARVPLRMRVQGAFGAHSNPCRSTSTLGSRRGSQMSPCACLHGASASHSGGSGARGDPARPRRDPNPRWRARAEAIWIPATAAARPERFADASVQGRAPPGAGAASPGRTGSHMSPAWRGVGAFGAQASACGRRRLARGSWKAPVPLGRNSPLGRVGRGHLGLTAVWGGDGERGQASCGTGSARNRGRGQRRAAAKSAQA